MNNPDIRLPAPQLTGFAESLLLASGTRPADAAAVAQHLVAASLAGHDSNGIGLLPLWLDHARSKFVRVDSQQTVLTETAIILRLDADGGWGPPAAEQLIDRAGAKALEHGLAAATLGNVHDLGRIGAYGEQAAAAGLAALIFVNITGQAPVMAPFHGSDARFGTDPVCIAFPATANRSAFLLDMATSRISLGRLKLAAARGQDIPPGSLINEHGMPTTDPSGMSEPVRRGALTPMGRHKGYGLALACELLGGVLSGGGTIQPEHPREGAVRNGLFAILINPAMFGEAGWMEHEIEALAKYALASPPMDWDSPVLYPGDPERALRGKRLRDGIPVTAELVETLNAAAAATGSEARL
ncbi:Ldh family oxidoreductase [Maricaulis sp.]|uniref:Ldh family oxidoreductase n=1 Tax=Maricaulis sp. TaxID=1486257 RepID=UPI003A8DB6A1